MEPGRAWRMRRPALKDRRVDVVVGDVLDTLTASEAFDAVLLDVDNGPDAFTSASNAALYGDRGLAVIRALAQAGRRRGRLVRLGRPQVRAAPSCGGIFGARRARAGTAQKGGPWHTIFLGTPSGSPVGRARERH